ncbi:MAG: thioredoxin family protein [Bacteroidetes bacterium]|nr:thioredoxin family protein [Bacteroidota bacterium]
MRYVVLGLIFWLSGSAAAQDSTLVVVRDSVRFVHMPYDTFTALVRFENKPYIILFTAPWCVPCQRLKKEVFADPQIAALVNKNYLAYYIDLENFDDLEVNSKVFHVEQLPTIYFFDSRSRLVDKAVGFFDAHYFFRKLREYVPPARRGSEWQGE